MYTKDKTQLLFIDTPGLVKKNECKKYKLEESFLRDASLAIKGADIIGIIQDISFIKTRSFLHKHIIEVLKNADNTIPSILIINKVDTIKKKDLLLQLVKSLTSEENWPHFKDVFMISALTGDGVVDLRVLQIY